MANVILSVTSTLMDHEGEEATVRGHLLVVDTLTIAQATTNADDFGLAVAALSDAVLVQSTFSFTKFRSFIPPDAGGAYDTAEDKVFLEYRSTTNGSRYTIQVPAPKADVLIGDNETVDPASDLMTAFNAYVSANLVTAQGTNNMEYVLGYRKRRHSRKERPGISTAQG